jgi:YVTN family beta-propeller protein
VSASAGNRLEFRILGPVEVAQNGERLQLGGEKQRALLALLLLHANQVVARDTIIDALWGDRPPPTAPAALNVYVSKLRKSLGATPDMLATRDPGYILSLDPGQLDVDRFAELAAEGKRALDSGDYKRAEWTLKGADSLFRGRPLADLSHEDFAHRASAELEERRLEALMDRIDAGLAQGQGSGLVAELEKLVAEHPFQERLWAELMRAFYLGGRQAEALEAYKRARTRLDELGIEPSPELKRLQSQILQQDPALRAAPPGPAPGSSSQPGDEPPSPRRRRPIVLTTAALLAALLAAIAFTLLRDGDAPAAKEVPKVANTVRVIDLATNEALAAVPIGGLPGGLASNSDAVWVANIDDATVLKIDPRTNSVVQTLGVPEVGDVAADRNVVWAVSGRRALLRIPPDHPDLSRATPLDPLSGIGDPAEISHVIALGAGSIWSINGLDGLARFDPGSGALMSRISLRGASPDELAFGEGSLWVADWVNRQVLQVDPRTERIVQRISVGQGPGAVAVGYGSVWVLDYVGNLIWRVNPLLGRVERSIPVGEKPLTIAVGAGAVWVANSYDSTVSKIDPTTNRVVRTIHVGFVPTRIVVGHGKLWVTTR